MATDTVTAQTIRFAYVPTYDEMFRWYALRQETPAGEANDFASDPRIDTDPFAFEHRVQPIGACHEVVAREQVDLATVAAHHYPEVADRYALLSCGATLADRFMPIIAGREMMTMDELRGTTLAVSDVETTPFVVASLLMGPETILYESVPEERMLEALSSGQYRAGLLVDVPRVRYADYDLRIIQDLGHWWKRVYATPMPTRVMVARRGLGDRTIRHLSRVLRAALEYAMLHRDDSLEWVVAGAAESAWDIAARCVDMYVNRWTHDLGEIGCESLELLWRVTAAAGLIPAAHKANPVQP